MAWTCLTRMHQTRLPCRLLHWEQRERRRTGRQRMRWKDAGNSGSTGLQGVAIICVGAM